MTFEWKEDDLTLQKLQGDVQILCEIGKGSYSVVFKAEWTLLDGAKRTIAVKSFKRTDKTTVRELNIFGHLGSQTEVSRIVSVFGWLENPHDSEAPWLLMELLNSSVKKLLEQRTHISWENKYVLLCDMVLAVQSLHHANPPILHRDIKTENFLVYKEGDSYRIKIADFGFCREDTQGSSADRSLIRDLGTPDYKPPEVLQRARYSVQSDIFSLGLAMAALVTGVEPKVALGENRFGPAFPTQQSPRVEVVIAHCVKAVAGDRPDSASSLLCQLRAAIQQDQEESKQTEDHKQQLLLGNSTSSRAVALVSTTGKRLNRSETSRDVDGQPSLKRLALNELNEEKKNPSNGDLSSVLQVASPIYCSDSLDEQQLPLCLAFESTWYPCSNQATLSHNDGRIYNSYLVNGMALDPVTRRIYTTNDTEERVRVFNHEQHRIDDLHVPGSTLWGLAYNPLTQCLFLVDRALGIHVFDRTGQVERRFPLKPPGTLYGVAVNPLNRLVYVCHSFGVQVFQADGTFVTQWGFRATAIRLEYSEYKSEPKAFLGVVAIACDSNGDVYVVDNCFHHVQVFDALGNFLKVFGGKGDPQGQLDNPMAIAIDSERGWIFVAEQWNNRIQVFDRQGLPIAMLAGSNSQTSQEQQLKSVLCRPRALCLDTAGRKLHVSHAGLSRICTFKY